MSIEASLHGLKQPGGGGGGGAQPPPPPRIEKHASWVSKRTIRFKATLHGLKARGVGGGTAPPPPPIANSARMMGFENTALKQACTAQRSAEAGLSFFPACSCL